MTVSVGVGFTLGIAFLKTVLAYLLLRVRAKAWLENKMASFIAALKAQKAMDTLAVVEGESNNRLVTMHSLSICPGDWCKNYTLRELQQSARPF